MNKLISCQISTSNCTVQYSHTFQSTVQTSALYGNVLYNTLYWYWTVLCAEYTVLYIYIHVHILYEYVRVLCTIHFLLISHTFSIHCSSVYIIHKFLEPSLYKCTQILLYTCTSTVHCTVYVQSTYNFKKSTHSIVLYCEYYTLLLYTLQLHIIVHQIRFLYPFAILHYIYIEYYMIQNNNYTIYWLVITFAHYYTK